MGVYEQSHGKGGRAKKIKEDVKSQGGGFVTSTIWCQIRECKGKHSGRGWGSGEGKEVVLGEAFKDCNCDKQGPWPSQMSWEEVEGGGKRKREGGRGQLSNPQSEGTRKCLQMECKG